MRAALRRGPWHEPEVGSSGDRLASAGVLPFMYKSPMQKLRVVIVSPALADANNGNWQTARRWQALLSPHSARIVKQWPDALAEQDQVMLALHARRSAELDGERASPEFHARMARLLAG